MGDNGEAASTPRSGKRLFSEVGRDTPSETLSGAARYSQQQGLSSSGVQGGLWSKDGSRAEAAQLRSDGELQPSSSTARPDGANKHHAPFNNSAAPSFESRPFANGIAHIPAFQPRANSWKRPDFAASLLSSQTPSANGGEKASLFSGGLAAALAGSDAAGAAPLVTASSASAAGDANAVADELKALQNLELSFEGVRAEKEHRISEQKRALEDLRKQMEALRTPVSVDEVMLTDDSSSDDAADAAAVPEASLAPEDAAAAVLAEQVKAEHLGSAVAEQPDAQADPAPASPAAAAAAATAAAAVAAVTTAQDAQTDRADTAADGPGPSNPASNPEAATEPGRCAAGQIVGETALVASTIHSTCVGSVLAFDELSSDRTVHAILGSNRYMAALAQTALLDALPAALHDLCLAGRQFYMQRQRLVLIVKPLLRSLWGSALHAACVSDAQARGAAVAALIQQRQQLATADHSARVSRYVGHLQHYMARRPFFPTGGGGGFGSEFGRAFSNIARSDYAEAQIVKQTMLMDNLDCRLPAQLTLDEQRFGLFVDSNMLVEDPVAQLQLEQIVRPWSKDEVKRMCEAFLIHDKNFRALSAAGGTRTPGECIKWFYQNHLKEVFNQTHRKWKMKKRRERTGTREKVFGPLAGIAGGMRGGGGGDAGSTPRHRRGSEGDAAPPSKRVKLGTEAFQSAVIRFGKDFDAIASFLNCDATQVRSFWRKHTKKLNLEGLSQFRGRDAAAPDLFASYPDLHTSVTGGVTGPASEAKAESGVNTSAYYGSWLQSSSAAHGDAGLPGGPGGAGNPHLLPHPPQLQLNRSVSPSGAPGLATGHLSPHLLDMLHGLGNGGVLNPGTAGQQPPQHPPMAHHPPLQPPHHDAQENAEQSHSRPEAYGTGNLYAGALHGQEAGNPGSLALFSSPEALGTAGAEASAQHQQHGSGSLAGVEGGFNVPGPTNMARPNEDVHTNMLLHRILGSQAPSNDVYGLLHQQQQQQQQPMPHAHAPLHQNHHHPQPQLPEAPLHGAHASQPQLELMQALLNAREFQQAQLHGNPQQQQQQQQQPAPAPQHHHEALARIQQGQPGLDSAGASQATPGLGALVGHGNLDLEMLRRAMQTNGGVAGAAASGPGADAERLAGLTNAQALSERLPHVARLSQGSGLLSPRNNGQALLDGFSGHLR